MDEGWHGMDAAPPGMYGFWGRVVIHAGHESDVDRLPGRGERMFTRIIFASQGSVAVAAQLRVADDEHFCHPFMVNQGE